MENTQKETERIICRYHIPCDVNYLSSASFRTLIVKFI